MKTALDVLGRLRELLEAPFPDEAYKEVTFEDGNKGMGLIAQYATDRLNEVFGLGGWSMPNEIEYVENHEKVVEVIAGGRLKIHSGGIVFETPECDGGCIVAAHQSIADARKYARTSLKSKCCSYLGIGASAYRGEITLVSDKATLPLVKEDIPEGERPVNYEMAPVLENESEAMAEMNDDKPTIACDYLVRTKGDLTISKDLSQASFCLADDSLGRIKAGDVCVLPNGFSGIVDYIAFFIPDYTVNLRMEVSENEFGMIPSGSEIKCFASEEEASPAHPIHTGADQKEMLQYILDTHGLSKDDIMAITDRSRVKVSFLKEFYSVIENEEQWPSSTYQMCYDESPIVSYRPLVAADPAEEEEVFPHDLPESPIKKEESPEPTEKLSLEDHMSGNAIYEPMKEKRGTQDAVDIYNQLSDEKKWGKSDAEDEDTDSLFAELDEMDANFPTYIKAGSVQTTLNNIARYAPEAMIDRLLSVS